jgi:hypothetical protein
LLFAYASVSARMPLSKKESEPGAVHRGTIFGATPT